MNVWCECALATGSVVRAATGPDTDKGGTEYFGACKPVHFQKSSYVNVGGQAHQQSLTSWGHSSLSLFSELDIWTRQSSGCSVFFYLHILILPLCIFRAVGEPCVGREPIGTVFIHTPTKWTQRAQSQWRVARVQETVVGFSQGGSKGWFILIIVGRVVPRALPHHPLLPVLATDPKCTACVQTGKPLPW